MFAPISRSAKYCGVALALLVATLPARAEGPPGASHKAFVLLEYQVRDQPLFVKVREKMRETLKSYHGELVTREKVQPIFGGSATNLSIVSFETVEAAKAWLASKEMAALAEQRAAATKMTTYVVEKMD